ncbi:MAG: dihydrolipoyl dehydrogenase family protein [Acidimicrobiales bacterium]
MPEKLRRDFDLIIVGLGSAGMVAADFATELRVRTAAVEGSRVGGDCLWTGCVPSKSLLAAAGTAHVIRTASRFGIVAAEPELDLAAVWRRIGEVQAAIAASDDSPERLRGEGIEVFTGESARLIDPHTIAVGGRILTSRFLLICTGSHPTVPPIPGLGETGFVTSETFFELPSPPPRLVFIGGGPISLELAQAMRRLGVEVTILELAAQIATREEPELVAALVAVLRREGVVIETGVEIAEVVSTEKGKMVRGSVSGKRRSWVADEIFVGTGRRPNLDGLGLENVGVEMRRAGIVVDRGLRTSVHSIYACGDATGRYLFTHSAGHEAVQALRGMFFPGQGRAPKLVPWCTFTDPQLAHVGLTVAEAEATHGKVCVYRSDMTHSDRARADSATEGRVLLITAKRRLVGAQILAPNAGEAIHELCLAISQGLKIEAIYNLVHIYPTYSTSVGQAAAQAGKEQVRRLQWLVRRRSRCCRFGASILKTR